MIFKKNVRRTKQTKISQLYKYVRRFCQFTEKKKTIQNTIPKRKIARWNTLTSVWPRVSNQDPKKLFFNPEKKMVDIQ